MGTPAVLLLVNCVTVPGAVFAIGAILLGLAPGLVCINPGSPWFRRASGICLGAWIIVTAWLAWISPDGRSPENARVQNRYSDGGWHYQRCALGALLPEIDQFMLGFQLVPAVDPLFTRRQARAVSSLTSAIYKDLEASADFHALGSVMPEAYSQVWGRPYDHGHYFLYIPANLDRKTPAPALVFLHGTGGNFKAYTWLLSRVADERGMVLIAPSFGMGKWDTEHGVQAVMAALDNAAKVVALDMSQVHLAGLSNGGLGVSRTAASEAGRTFRSLIFLSSVCDKGAVSSLLFSSQWRDKPVLIVTGDKDDRVPLPYVQRCTMLLRKSGAAVEISTYAGADHFLFFSHRDRMLGQLSDWLKEHSAPSH